MKFTILASAIISLVGCTTPVEIRKNPPLVQYQSKKTSKALAICIADKWESNGVFGSTIPISMRQTADGYTVSMSANGNTMLLVDIVSILNGSKTSYFKGIVWGEGSFDLIVKECQ